MMIKEIKSKFIIVAIVSMTTILVSCNNSSSYHKLVEQELATQVKNDTLLHGIRFGMNKREFFAHCWELHKQGVFREGTTNNTVFYEFEKNDKKYHVNFYPNFLDGKIVELPVEYTYAAFAPWNPKYSLEFLHQEIKDLYITEFGKDYLSIKSENQDNGEAYVWVDGNRRISLYKNINRNSVTALYFDLSSKKETDIAPNDADL